MNFVWQLVIVFVILIVAVLYIIKNIYGQIKKGDKCSGCPISEKCNRRDKLNKGDDCKQPTDSGSSF